MDTMDDSKDDDGRDKAAEDLVLRTIAGHADSLLRTARRHSICLDDAEDAYQHAIEIFMREAPRLDPGRAPGWLHVVVKREAQALRATRQRLVTSTALDLDRRESSDVPTPEERVLRFDVMSRSAEALKRLKPQELRALWLRAQGHTYGEIGAITGWSYTKINRCLAEGRRSFLERYERIESGEECQHWLPVISAMVDGEATPEQVGQLRPHLRNCSACRATLKALRDSSTPLAALLPVPLVVVDAGSGEDVSNLVMRVYDAISNGFHERAVHSVTRAQSMLEVVAAGKVTAVAASAAVVAGGGYATVEQAIERPPTTRTVAAAHVRAKAPVRRSRRPTGRAASDAAARAATAGPAPATATATAAKASVAVTTTVPRGRSISATTPRASPSSSSGQTTTRAAGYAPRARDGDGSRRVAASFTVRGHDAGFAP